QLIFVLANDRQIKPAKICPEANAMRRFNEARWVPAGVLYKKACARNRCRPASRHSRLIKWRTDRCPLLGELDLQETGNCAHRRPDPDAIESTLEFGCPTIDDGERLTGPEQIANKNLHASRAERVRI